MADQKQLQNVEYFNCLCSMMTGDTRYTCEIKSRSVVAKAEFDRKKTFFTNKVDLNWRIALYDAENWTFWKVDRKYVESFEMLCRRKMEKISWTDNVTNEDVLDRVKEDRNILRTRKEGRLTGLIISCAEIVFWNKLLKERWKKV